MAGFDNDVMFSRGSRVEPTTAADFVTMQNSANDLGIMNISGSPEGVVSANIGSIACDRTNGRLYQKVSGVGNTGWQQIPAGGDIPESFVTNAGTATPAAGIINFVVGTASTTSGAGNTVTLPQGNVVGPVLSTDNAVVRYDLATGLLIQNSGVTITDADVCNGITQLNVDNLRLDGNTLSSTNADGYVVITPDNTSSTATVDIQALRVFQDISASGAQVRCRMQNSNATVAAQSDCFHSVQVHDSGIGDPYYAAIISGAHAYMWGIDQSVNTDFRIAYQGGTSNPNFPGDLTALDITIAGAVSVPAGNLSVSRSASGSTVSATVSNTSNTASSNALDQLTVAGTSAGDPFTTYTVTGGSSWSQGADNSVTGDPYVLAASTALGTTNTMVVTTAGEITMPLQPAFLAYLATNDDNSTGDGTSFTFGSITALTEIFDQGGDFATSGTFTAPVTGKYLLGANIMFQGLVSATNGSNNSIITSNNTFTIGNNAQSFTGNNAYNYFQFCDMDAADTASVSLAITGGTKIVDLFGGTRTNFYGSLEC